MKKIIKYTLFSLFLLFTLSYNSTQSLAADHQEGIEGVDFLIFKGPLVPCGIKDSSNNSTHCTLCHLFILIKNIFDLILSLLIVTSILFIAIGGVLYIVSTGNSNLTNLAKGIITKTLTGFGLFLLAWLIVFVIIKLLSYQVESFDPDKKWYEIDCKTENKFTETTPEQPAPSSPSPTPSKKIPSPGPGSETTQEAASALLGKAILHNNPDCNDMGGNGVTPEANLKDAAAGKKSIACHSSCSKTDPCKKPVTLNLKMLNAANYIADNHEIVIVSIAGGQHTSNSQHYQGTAMDIEVTSDNAQEREQILTELKAMGATKAFCDNAGKKVDCTKATHIHFDYR